MKGLKFRLKVLPKEAGSRLDAWLARRLRHHSRSQWATHIRAREVLVDNKTAKPRHLLKKGQLVAVAIKKIVSTAPKIAIPILHQENDFLVINKPAGVVAHPTSRHRSGTVLDLLMAKFPESYLVHRLDKDTSGVMLVARNIAAKNYLSGLFAKRLVKKTYLALLAGHLKPAQAYLDLPIKRGRSGKFEVGRGGRSAKSFYKVLEYLPGFSLVEVHPESGRTHQIRVHFKALKHPVVGDEMYGKKAAGLSRQFLHAAKIEFADMLGRPRQFAAPLPDELNNFLDESR